MLAMVALTAMPVRAAVTNLSWKAEATVKESYDSNVYLQDNAPNPGNVQAAELAGLHPVQANKGSMVTTITPKIGLDYKPGAAFNLSASAGNGPLLRLPMGFSMKPIKVPVFRWSVHARLRQGHETHGAPSA